MSSISATDQPFEEIPPAEKTPSAPARDREVRDAGLAAMVVVLSLLSGLIFAQVMGLTRAHSPQLSSMSGVLGVGLCLISLVCVPVFLRKCTLQTLLIAASIIFFAGGMLLSLTV